MVQHFTARLRDFCTMDDAELENKETWVPKFSLLPAAVAKEAAETEETGKQITPWEL